MFKSGFSSWWEVVSLNWVKGFGVMVEVEMEVQDFELVVGHVMRLVRGCFNGRVYFLGCSSLLLEEANVSNVNAQFFCMIM